MVSITSWQTKDRLSLVNSITTTRKSCGLYRYGSPVAWMSDERSSAIVAGDDPVLIVREPSAGELAKYDQELRGSMFLNGTAFDDLRRNRNES
jgi:hypothetical protein